MATESNSLASQQRFSRGLLALALTSSLLASTCCVLPLLLVLVGIGGAWMTHLAALKPYVLSFTFVAVGALTWAGYLVFRPTQTCAPEGDDCNSRTTKKVFIVCAIFIAALLLFPLAAPLFY